MTPIQYRLKNSHGLVNINSGNLILQGLLDDSL